MWISSAYAALLVVCVGTGPSEVCTGRVVQPLGDLVACRESVAGLADLLTLAKAPGVPVSVYARCVPVPLPRDA